MNGLSCFLHHGTFGDTLYTLAVACSHELFPECGDSVGTKIIILYCLDYFIVIYNNLTRNKALVIKIKASVVLILFKVIRIEKHRLVEQSILKYQRRIIGNQNICGTKCSFDFQVL